MILNKTPLITFVCLWVLPHILQFLKVNGPYRTSLSEISPLGVISLGVLACNLLNDIILQRTQHL